MKCAVGLRRRLCLGEESFDFITEIRELALGKTNDAVRLVFLNPENNRLPGKLDLRMISEIKRSSNGSVEIKLLNRIELLKLLAELTSEQSPAPGDGDEAERFFSAMDKAAARIKDNES